MPKQISNTKVINYTITDIQYFSTFIYTLPSKERVASIILPSCTIPSYVDYSCNINKYTGNKTGGRSKFIPDSIIYEINDLSFRIGAQNNLDYIKSLSFEFGVLWGFEQAVKDWLYSLPGDINKTRVFGGDILCAGMFNHLYKAMQHTTDKEMLICTHNEEGLNKSIICTSDSKPVDNLHIIIYDKCNSKKFKTFSYSTDSTGVPELLYYPNSNSTENISFLLSEENFKYAASGKPWWK